ncbi:hypothetical protein HDU98_003642 [Podochytrium sp. JEL0797]|nr:hypothetical protein HDU98_003642 [Podochytrium sp. JEL0797]
MYSATTRKTAFSLLTILVLLAPSSYLLGLTPHGTGLNCPNATSLNTTQEKEPSWCILQVSSALNASLLAIIDQIKTKQDVQKFLTAHPSVFHHLETLSLLLTRLYAMEQNYTHLTSHGDPYITELESKNLAHAKYWLKPMFARDTMENHSECEWIALWDLDAFPWMESHTLSFNKFFDAITPTFQSKNYQSYVRAKLAGVPFYEQSAVLLVATNGERLWHSRGTVGWPEDNDVTLVNSGVFMVKNCARGRQLMVEWLDGPLDASEEEKELWVKRDWPHADQGGLNLILDLRYQEEHAMYPYQDFHDHNNGFIRHGAGDHKQRVLVNARQKLIELGFKFAECGEATDCS